MRFRKSVAGPMEEACSPMTWREVVRREVSVEGANDRVEGMERVRLTTSVASKFVRQLFLNMTSALNIIRKVEAVVITGTSCVRSVR